MGANDSKRKPPSEMSKTVPPSSCSSCRKANSFGTVLVFSRRSRVTFLRVMSFRRLVYFRNALQRRGGGGLANLWAWGGGGTRPPRHPGGFILFPPGEETRGVTFGVWGALPPGEWQFFLGGECAG